MKDSERIENAQAVIEKILGLMGVDADIKASVKSDDTEKKYLEIIIEGEELGYLIGFRGKTLNALQTIVSQILFKGDAEMMPTVVDVNNYRQRRNEYLLSLAARAAAEARETKQNIELPPLSSFERRVVHLALKDEQDIVTESTGIGQDRHIVVKFTPK